jgi:LPXTG-motif cell wall-anchored protein
VPIHIPAQLLVAQAIAEHGLLDAMAAGIANARYHLEIYIGEGNTIYVLAGAALLLALFLFRRRR